MIAKTITCLPLNVLPDDRFDERLICSIGRTNIAVVLIETKNFFNQADTLFNTLCPSEMISVNNLQSEILKTKYVIHRGLLRLLISKLIKKSPMEIELETSSYGKPSLKTNNKLDLHFNLSHSSNFAFYSFTIGSPIGIDVEEDNNDTCIDPLVPLIFSACEIEAFKSFNSGERRHAFFQLWTTKEALSKYYGYGLNIDFTTLHIGLNHEGALDVCRFYNDALIFDISKKSSYYAALAVAVN